MSYYMDGGRAAGAAHGAASARGGARDARDETSQYPDRFPVLAQASKRHRPDHTASHYTYDTHQTITRLSRVAVGSVSSRALRRSCRTSHNYAVFRPEQRSWPGVTQPAHTCNELPWYLPLCATRGLRTRFFLWLSAKALDYRPETPHAMLQPHKKVADILYFLRSAATAAAPA